MAMKNEEVIDLLQNIDRLSKVDPKLQKVVTDRAIKAIQEMDSATEERTDVAKKLNALKSIARRFIVMITKDAANLEDPCNYWKNAMATVGNSIVEIDSDLKDPMAALDSIIDNLDFVFKSVCFVTFGGAMCCYCSESGNCSFVISKEEQQKIREQFEKLAEEESAKEEEPKEESESEASQPDAPEKNWKFWKKSGK